MAFKHVNSQTLTTVSALFTVDKNARPLTPVNIHNGHSAAIFVGDTTISTSGATIGRTIAAGANQLLYVNPNDVIYAISAAASAAGAVVVTYSA
jgi:uncharacterized RmlC-like cupin family protein